MEQQSQSGRGINTNIRFLAAQLGLKKHKVIFFLGAGVSRASGLPLGDQLRDKILRQLYREFPFWEDDMIEKFRSSFGIVGKNVIPEMVLQQFAQHLGCGSVDDFLKPVFEGRKDELLASLAKKEPSWTHEVLASLAKKGFVSLILTMNLDNLLEEALGREGVNFRVVSARNAVVLTDGSLGNKVRIWKIHGKRGKPESLSVTEEVVRQYPKRKEVSLHKIFQNHTIVFVGYSMRDQDFLHLITEVKKNNRYSFICVGRRPFHKVYPEIQQTLGSPQNYIQMHSDDFFNELAYLLDLRPAAIIWKADEAMLLRGGMRGEDDPWNRDCEPFTRIYGAGPDQENFTDWEGATIQLRRCLQHPLKLRHRCNRASLRIEIPPIDGKGIHGKEGGKVTLWLIKNNGDRLKLSELICTRPGYLNTWWPHKDRYIGIHPGFLITRVEHFDGLQDITLELQIESQVCMDVSRFLLYFY